jgi:nucleotide-binding universal stress UspA family protein
MPAPRRILVPTDFSARSLGALRYARDLARAFGSPLHLLHVLSHPVQWSPEVADPALAAAHRQSRAEAELELIALATEEGLDPLTTTTAVVAGGVDHAILTYARAAGADLIVMGTHGHAAIARFLLGSVTERVVRRASCPVVVVPHRPIQQAAVLRDEMGVRPMAAAS